MGNLPPQQKKQKTKNKNPLIVASSNIESIVQNKAQKILFIPKNSTEEWIQKGAEPFRAQTSNKCETGCTWQLSE